MITWPRPHSKFKAEVRSEIELLARVCVLSHRKNALPFSTPSPQTAICLRFGMKMDNMAFCNEGIPLAEKTYEVLQHHNHTINQSTALTCLPCALKAGWVDPEISFAMVSLSKWGGKQQWRRAVQHIGVGGLGGETYFASFVEIFSPRKMQIMLWT